MLIGKDVVLADSIATLTAGELSSITTERAIPSLIRDTPQRAQRGLSKNTQRLMTQLEFANLMSALNSTWRRETLYKCAQNQG